MNAEGTLSTQRVARPGVNAVVSSVARHPLGGVHESAPISEDRVMSRRSGTAWVTAILRIARLSVDGLRRRSARSARSEQARSEHQ